MPILYIYPITDKKLCENADSPTINIDFSWTLIFLSFTIQKIGVAPYIHYISCCLMNIFLCYCAFISSVDSHPISKSISNAMSNPFWQIRKKDEMHALDKNEICEVVPLPTTKKTVGNQRLYTVKLNSDGTLARLKTHLVVNRYFQTYSITKACSHHYEKWLHFGCLFHLLL